MLHDAELTLLSTVCAEVVTFTNGYGILGMTCGAENMIEAFRIREEANEMQKE